MATPRNLLSAATTALLLLALASPVSSQTPTQTLNLGEWYVVTCPQTLLVGTTAEITVAYRGITDKTKLCCDLHCQLADGSTGFYANDWRPKPDIIGEGQYTFTVPIREREGLVSATLLVFTDPAGAWATHTRLVTSAPIPVKDPDPGYSTWTRQCRFNKSWLGFDWTPLQKPLVEGDKLEVTLEYYLDPSEHYGKTELRLEMLGPRVPKPGVPRPVSFANTQHLWYGQKTAPVQPGRGRQTFTITVPKAQAQNGLLMLALFTESRGKRWPWDIRADVGYARQGGYFELGSDKPANLFTYDEPVRLLARLKHVKPDQQKRWLKYTVTDCAGGKLFEGDVSFRAEQEGQVVPIEPDLATRRGTFCLRAEVEGWEARETTFCRIPDVLKITGGKPTPFGMTIHEGPALEPDTEEVFQAARRLGLTSCRAFTVWSTLEPGPGVYAFPYWDRFFEAAKANGVDTTICLYGAPAWAMPRGQMVSYRMFDCDLDRLAELVKAVSERYRGKFWGWEWLNEICPGGPEDEVGKYVQFCRRGVETAHAVDPALHSVLAGGLWPRGFRLDVLNAGVGKYIDVLPIHYGNGSGITEARSDLHSFGLDHVAVWDNESAAEMITWDWTGQEVVSEKTKSAWVLNQWTDELAAGAEKVVYFGGAGSSIGSFDYLLADHSPLPVAATLAVLASKLWDAHPLGTISSQGKAGVIHVFERQGKPVLVASSTAEGGEGVPLATGTPSLTATDYQGNETVLTTTGREARLPLQALPCFVEGGDLEVIKAYLVPSIAVPTAGGKREAIGTRPTISLLQGQPGKLPVRLWNPYSRPLAGTLTTSLPAAWGAPQQTPFSLAPGETRQVAIPLTVPDTAGPEAHSGRLDVAFQDSRLPTVRKPFVLSVFSRAAVGNLLANGDFEQAAPDGTTPLAWRGVNARLAPAQGGLGLGKQVLRFEKATEWAHYAQSLDLRGGLTYLYTAWVYNQGMSGGSNISQTMADGSRADLYDKQVFDIGQATPSWQVFTCRYKAPADLKSASFVPVTKGDGWAAYDNLRLTVFEGTDFAAEAWAVKTPPQIDGKLDDWAGKCPIPLIGRNQLQATDPAYKWTPDSLSGVAYVTWDASNLYLAVQVKDDKHADAGEGETVLQGDSLVLALDPTAGGLEAGQRAFAYYLSSRRPGMGSGTVTLWRSQQHNGGKPAGHLARDSSLYDVAVRPGEGGCVYELRLPVSELGFSPTFGAKLGLSLQLSDSDGGGSAARMTWGGGLAPAWAPEAFGRVTLVE